MRVRGCEERRGGGVIPPSRQALVSDALLVIYTHTLQGPPPSLHHPRGIAQHHLEMHASVILRPRWDAGASQARMHIHSSGAVY